MKKIGVIIGRFQVAKLHAGHKHLFQAALSKCDELIVLVGNKHINPTKRNPLSFEERQSVILEDFPKAYVYELLDNQSDEAWSRSVDNTVRMSFVVEEVTLFGSRDSFASHYSGSFPVTIIPELPGHSGSEERQKVGRPTSKESYRAGLIAAQTKRFPISYQTVDIGLVDWTKKQILLGRKPDDEKGKWRLPGGFVDPSDESLEAAAARELSEEVGNVLTDKINYLGSQRVADFRYRGECDQIMTALFLTYYMGGTPKAGDDLSEVAWFTLEEAQRLAMPAHQKLVASICKKVLEEAQQ